jgi:hypothetical protein
MSVAVREVRCHEMSIGLRCLGARRVEMSSVKFSRVELRREG